MNGGFGGRSGGLRALSRAVRIDGAGSFPNPPAVGRSGKAGRHRPAPLRCRFSLAGGVLRTPPALFWRRRLSGRSAWTKQRHRPPPALLRLPDGTLRDRTESDPARRRRRGDHDQRRRAASLRALAADRTQTRGTVCLLPGAERDASRNISRRSATSAAAASPWRRSTGAGRAARSGGSAIRRKGHIDSFAEYDRDLDAFMQQVALPDCPPPHYRAGPFDRRARLPPRRPLRAARASRAWCCLRRCSASARAAVAGDRLPRGGAPHRASASARSSVPGRSRAPHRRDGLRRQPADQRSGPLRAQPRDRRLAAAARGRRADLRLALCRLPGDGGGRRPGFRPVDPHPDPDGRRRRSTASSRSSAIERLAGELRAGAHVVIRRRAPRDPDGARHGSASSSGPRSTPSFRARRDAQLIVSRRAGRGRCSCSRGSPLATIRPPSRGRAAVPVGDPAAGALDDRDQRDDVVGLQPGLDDAVGVAGGDHAIGVAVAAVAGEADRASRPGHRRRARRRRRVTGLVVNSAASARSAQARVAQRRRCRPGPVYQAVLAVAGEALAGERLGHHAENRDAVLEEADQRAPDRQAGDEGAGAVDRVEHPDDIRRRRGRSPYSSPMMPWSG